MKEMIIIFVTLSLIAVTWQLWYFKARKASRNFAAFPSTLGAVLVTAATLAPFFVSLSFGTWWLAAIAVVHLFTFVGFLIFLPPPARQKSTKGLNVDTHLIEVNQPAYKFK